MFLNLLLLQGSSPAPAPTGSPFGMLLPMLLVFAIFYLLLFLPMQRQRKKQAQLLRDLKNGSNVLTTSGIIGTITEIRDDDTIVLRVKPDGVKLHMARNAVSTVLPEAEAKQ